MKPDSIALFHTEPLEARRYPVGLGSNVGVGPALLLKNNRGAIGKLRTVKRRKEQALAGLPSFHTICPLFVEAG